MRTLQGIIVSDKMRKTRVVAVEHQRKHPRLGKLYQVTERFKAHDEEERFHTGDVVTIQESRPRSKDKRWVIVAKVEVKQG